MKIAQDIGINDAYFGVSLEEDDHLEVPFYSYSSSPENGRMLVVNSLRVGIDLVTGEAIVKAYGYLRNKDGRIGERSRDMFLEPDQIPDAVREIAAAQARGLRERIAAGGEVYFS